MTRKTYSHQATNMDNIDPCKKMRNAFILPKNKIYLCSNSLGLPPKKASALLQKHIEKWANEGANGWFTGVDNWYTSISQQLNHYLSKILGSNENEVVVMNSLTVNLHLLFTSFYQPTKKRYKIIIDAPIFPSDLYAIKSHLKRHALDSTKALIILKPRFNEHLLRIEDIENTLTTHGESSALIFLSGVNYLTGQVFNIRKITSLAHHYGCLAGFDLAHAAGNILLNLHRDQVDFALGCTYKYLSSGPGGPGFAFIHQKHHSSVVPRLSGWWGNDPSKRFQMNLQEEFLPYGGAASWQVSTPPILAMQPLLASLLLFNKIGMPALREKSTLQTAFLIELLENIGKAITIISPLNSDDRGCQISIQIKPHAKKIVKKLWHKRIICDFREPYMIRITPSPLYNSFCDIEQFIKILKTFLLL